MGTARPTREALATMTISAVLERWPATADVFHHHAMACVGCAVAPFYTIRDAAEVYGIPADAFVEDLFAAIQTPIPGQMTTHE